MLLGMVFQCEYPACISRLTQPWRGLAFTVVCLVVGGVVSVGSFFIVGAGLLQPPPFLMVYLIMSVPVCLFMVAIFDLWPLRKFFSGAFSLGFLVLLSVYAITYFIYASMMNFNLENIDSDAFAYSPNGFFASELVLVVMIAAVVPMIMLALLDFWPVKLMAGRFPSMQRQPFFGLVCVGFISLFVLFMFCLFVFWQGLPLVQFANLVCVPMIFGLFVLQVMFGGLPCVRISQPWRGVVLIVISLLLSYFMTSLYKISAGLWLGIDSGAPDYSMEMWLAPSLLSVTFPLMVIFADLFQSWPVKRSS